jgi:Caspase domain
MRQMFSIFALSICVVSSLASAQSPPVATAILTPYPGQKPYLLPRRQALVIGVAKQSDDAGFFPLKNPPKDIEEVSRALRAIGFSVTNLNDSYDPHELTRQNLKKAIYDYAEKLKAAPWGVGLIYFAGHGVERGNEIYLAPYDSYVRFDRDLSEELIPLSLFLDAFKYAGNQFNFVILDVCRDTPWRSLKTFGSSTSAPKHTRRLEYVVLATSVWSGSPAYDGAGDLSPYARAFIDALQAKDDGYLATFGHIGASFHALKGEYPAIVPPPNPQGASGKEFIFNPTEASFNREKKAFDVGVKEGSRPLLNELLYRFPAGYFSRAIAEYNKGAKLAPSPEGIDGIEWQPKGVIKLKSNLELREKPDGGSKVVEAKEAGKSLILLDGPEKANWKAVLANNSIAYIQTSQVAVQKPRETQTIKVGFDAGPVQGVDVLTPESFEEIKSVFSGDGAETAGSVEVVGYTAPGQTAANQLDLLARQATVVEALAEAGFQGSRVTVSTKESSRATNGPVVEVVVRGAENWDIPGSGTVWAYQPSDGEELIWNYEGQKSGVAKNWMTYGGRGFSPP